MMLFRRIFLRLPKCPKMSEPCSRHASTDTQEVLFRVENNKGIITLNRPKALNALNLSMTRLIYPMLKKWESDKLGLVIIEGSGEKAFCAGGDIRAITSATDKGSVGQCRFFAEEYCLNNLIGTLKIPYVAFIDGITMGGGVGLSVHGKFRVSTERTVFAMPETGIGLFPDVGGSYFLPRLSGQLGTFLALTGHRLKGADCLLAGISTHGCPSGDLPKLKDEIIKLPESSKPEDLQDLLSHYTSKFVQPPFSLADKLDLINSTFDSNSVEEIIQKLSDTQTSEKKWASDQVELMKKMSPTSMKVTLRQLREGAKLGTLEDCLKMEYRIVRRFCQGQDFYEGVRSVLVDRDGKPKWNPDSIQNVSIESVEKYFAPLPRDEELSFDQ